MERTDAEEVGWKGEPERGTVDGDNMGFEVMGVKEARDDEREVVTTGGGANSRVPEID